MKKSSRAHDRIDYKTLHSTGVKSLLPLSSELKMADEKTSALRIQIIQQESLAHEIDDFLDENPVNEFSDSIKDVDTVLEQLKSLRNKYRQLNLTVISETPPDDSTDNINKVTSLRLEAIKSYIKSANHFRKSICDQEIHEKSTQKELMRRSLEFELSNTLKFVKEIEMEVNIQITSLNDDELERRASGIPEVKRRCERLTKKITELLTQPANETALAEIKERYEKLQPSMTCYFSKVLRERENRELVKQKLFKESSLNIKLSKFKGYSSSTDIYSFQNDFEKLHLRTTPKYLLPDLLRNNFLDEPALSLVKGIVDIDSIWERLKLAYGDPKTMLNKKLSQLNNHESLWKNRDPEKIADGLSKIVSVIKDLVTTSKKHNIENKLYNGDALERIFRLLGDARVTRWLSDVCDQTMSDDQYWNKLVNFLEKDIKIQHQKLLFKSTFFTRGKRQQRKKSTMQLLWASRSCCNSRTPRYENYSIFCMP